jgi:hypothetical protein
MVFALASVMFLNFDLFYLRKKIKRRWKIGGHCDNSSPQGAETRGL